MAVSTSANLSVTVAHAISFLTRPLIPSYPVTTIIKLQLVLEANLVALYAPSWVVNEPLRSSGRRCLTLSPNCLPPRAIYSACIAANVQWFDWIALLGGREFDLFVDPGSIAVRYSGQNGSGCRLTTIWSDELPSPTIAIPKPQVVISEESTIYAAIKADQDPLAKSRGKTLAQQLLEEDTEEDEQLFAMIADEVRAPTWMTSILDQFPMPVPVRSSSSLSEHSRSSSRSSNSSSGFSFASADSSSVSSMSTSSVPTPPKQSRRERARRARVFVDTSKTEVTPYDGGKTTVLTGGVMLGGASGSGNKSDKSAGSWRSARA